MIVMLNWYQLSTGHEEGVLESEKTVTYVQAPLVKSLAQFKGAMGLSIRIPPLWKPRKRERVVAIMDKLDEWFSALDM